MKGKEYILSIFLFLIITIAYFKYKGDFIADLILSVFLVIVLYFLYKKLKLNVLTYSLVCLAFILHNLGAFGFYDNFFIPYDYITHFVGIFSITLIIANLLSYYLLKDKKFRTKDWVILLLVVLSGLGVGSLVETIEFGGYLVWGMGEGFFQFGTGDYVALSQETNLVDIVGGGYFDAMGDLVVNLIGALSAVLVYLCYFKIKKYS
jgi:uncharacterized membrane protein YjdF